MKLICEWKDKDYYRIILNYSTKIGKIIDKPEMNANDKWNDRRTHRKWKWIMNHKGISNGEFKWHQRSIHAMPTLNQGLMSTTDGKLEWEWIRK